MFDCVAVYLFEAVSFQIALGVARSSSPLAVVAATEADARTHAVVDAVRC